MPREVKRVTIKETGRDFGKVFELHEMPSDQGERWATRAILALANAGAKLPEGVLDKGMAGLEISWRNILVMGMRSLEGLTDPAVRPLLDELKPCIFFVPPGAPGVVQPLFPGENSQVEEYRTWYTLYVAMVELLLGFSLADVLSTSGDSSETPPAS